MKATLSAVRDEPGRTAMCISLILYGAKHAESRLPTVLLELRRLRPANKRHTTKVHPCVSTTASQGGGKELAEGIAPVVGQKPTPGSNDEAPLLYTDEGYLESWARTLLGGWLKSMLDSGKAGL